MNGINGVRQPGPPHWRPRDSERITAHSLPERDLVLLGPHMVSRTFVRNECIFDEGDNADALYFLRDGLVRQGKMLLNGKRQVTGFLRRGTLFGFACNRRFTQRAEAVTAVEACRIAASKFDALCEQDPILERHLLDCVTGELATAQTQLLLLGRKSTQERLASFLLQQRDDRIAAGLAPDPIVLEMTRADIGDYLGISLETVSRTITQMRKAGLIRLQGCSSVSLLDLAGLRDIALSDERP